MDAALIALAVFAAVVGIVAVVVASVSIARDTTYTFSTGLAENNRTVIVSEPYVAGVSSNVQRPTELTYLSGVSQPVGLPQLLASYAGAVTGINSQTDLVNWYTAAADGDIGELQSSFALTSSISFPDKKLLLRSAAGGPYIITYPGNFTITFGNTTKETVVQDCQIQHTSYTGSTNTLIACGNSLTRFTDCTLIFVEFGVTFGSSPQLFVKDCTISYDEATGSPTPNSTIRAFYTASGLASSTTTYVYIMDCTVNSIGTVTPVTGLHFVQISGVPEGADLTITGCTFDTDTRLRSVLFFEGGFSSTARNTGVYIDNNTITNRNTRDGVVIIFKSEADPIKPLDRFKSVYIVNNDVQRLDTEKMLLFLDNSFAPAGTVMFGSADVNIFNNNVPAVSFTDPTLVSFDYDGLVRGTSTITSVYLNKYS